MDIGVHDVVVLAQEPAEAIRVDPALFVAGKSTLSGVFGPQPSHLVLARRSLREVQLLMGHHSITTTERYAHIAETSWSRRWTCSMGWARTRRKTRERVPSEGLIHAKVEQKVEHAPRRVLAWNVYARKSAVIAVG